MYKNVGDKRLYDFKRYRSLRTLHPEWWEKKLEKARLAYHAWKKYQCLNVCQKCKNQFRCERKRQRFCSISCANSGERSSFWKRGHFLTGNKYRKVYARGYAVPRNHILEHRLIMEQHLGRRLTRREVVHHVNGNKLDNRLKNLYVLTIGEHNHLHKAKHPRLHGQTPPKFWEKAWLIQNYLVRQRSSTEIAQQFGCAAETILFWLSKHGIPRRSMKEVRKVKYWKG